MNEPKTKPVIVASKKVKPSSSEDSSDEENAPTNVELPQKKTKPQSSSDSSDDSDAPQKPIHQNDSIVKKQDTKAVPVSKQITKQPFVAAKHPNGSSDSSDDDDTVTSISKKPDAPTLKKKVCLIENVLIYSAYSIFL